MATTIQTQTWEALLKKEKQKPYFKALLERLNAASQNGAAIYPPKPLIFNAIKQCPYDNTKVVIIGQDPYHGPGQAHGLSFSVPDGIRKPPSLQNIFKEMHADVAGPIPQSGDLTYLAKQGVLLLNASLTVPAGEANAHANWGWQTFTDKIVTLLNDHPEPLVFMLWGAFATKKCAHIDAQRHCILRCAHPSPLAAHRGFFGCKHFSKANQFLKAHNRAPINWLAC
jgi:uracil-DNA glycosylase